MAMAMTKEESPLQGPKPSNIQQFIYVYAPQTIGECAGKRTPRSGLDLVMFRGCPRRETEDIRYYYLFVFCPARKEFMRHGSNIIQR